MEGSILNKSENATQQYFTFCEKVLDKTYLLKLSNDSQTSRKFINLSLLVSELCSCLCFQLYSLNFAIAIAHAQKGLLCLSELAIIV